MQHPKHDNNGKRIEKSKRTRWGVRWQNNLTLGMLASYGPTWHTESSIHIINTNCWQGGCIVLDGYLKHHECIFKVRQADNRCQQGHVGCWLRCSKKQKCFITVLTGNDCTASGYVNLLDILLEKLSPLFSLDGNIFLHLLFLQVEPGTWRSSVLTCWACACVALMWNTLPAVGSGVAPVVLVTSRQTPDTALLLSRLHVYDTDGLLSDRVTYVTVDPPVMQLQLMSQNLISSTAASLAYEDTASLKPGSNLYQYHCLC